MNMYRRTGNYPCVTILSLGNEAGNGVNFYEAYRRLKELEKDGQNRPVCYERAEQEWNTDRDADTSISEPVRKYPLVNYWEVQKCR